MGLLLRIFTTAILTSIAKGQSAVSGPNVALGNYVSLYINHAGTTPFFSDRDVTTCVALPSGFTAINAVLLMPFRVTRVDVVSNVTIAGVRVTLLRTGTLVALCGMRRVPRRTTTSYYCSSGQFANGVLLILSRPSEICEIRAYSSWPTGGHVRVSISAAYYDNRYTYNATMLVDANTSTCRLIPAATLVNITTFFGRFHKVSGVILVAENTANDVNIVVYTPRGRRPRRCCTMNITLVSPDTNVCDCGSPQYSSRVSVVFEPLAAPLKLCEIEAYYAVDGQWGPWSAFGPCSVTCGRGGTFRSRTCNNPPPRNGGSQCAGNPWDLAFCSSPCPVDGNWGAWIAGRCSVTCGNGRETFTRTCSNPPPRHGGRDCFGFSEMTGPCVSVICPIDGGWASWTYGRCSVTCGSGIEIGKRGCDDPTPAFNGVFCRGDLSTTKLCKKRACNVLHRLPVKIAVFSVVFLLSATVTLVLLVILVITAICRHKFHRNVKPVTGSVAGISINKIPSSVVTSATLEDLSVSSSSVLDDSLLNETTNYLS